MPYLLEVRLDHKQRIRPCGAIPQVLHEEERVEANHALGNCMNNGTFHHSYRMMNVHETSRAVRNRFQELFSPSLRQVRDESDFGNN